MVFPGEEGQRNLECLLGSEYNDEPRHLSWTRRWRGLLTSRKGQRIGDFNALEEKGPLQGTTGGGREGGNHRMRTACSDWELRGHPDIDDNRVYRVNQRVGSGAGLKAKVIGRELVRHWEARGRTDLALCHHTAPHRRLQSKSSKANFTDQEKCDCSMTLKRLLLKH